MPSLLYSPVDYEAIEAAVVETERGRWFLSEYQRRNRFSDTQQVLGAIERMSVCLTETMTETFASAPVQVPQATAPDPAVAVLTRDLVEMARRIADTHTEVAAIGSQDHDPSHVDLVSGELDAIVRSTERATSEILEAAEQIQEIAWTLREGGLAVETCDAVDARATNIYLACSFQDLTAQRTTKVMETMRFLENRIHKMINVLQGVEGFAITDLPMEASETATSAFEARETSLAQTDVDFALEWVNEQKREPSGPIVDAFASFAVAARPGDADALLFSDEGIAAPVEPPEAWFSEAEIAASLDTLKPDPVQAPRLVLLPGTPIAGPTAAHEAEAHGSADGVGSQKRLVELEAMDDADVAAKLSLFT